MKTEGNQSAHPEITTEEAIDKNQNYYGSTYSYGGLTKREYFAAMALASGSTANDAVAKADALIEALNKATP